MYVICVYLMSEGRLRRVACVRTPSVRLSRRCGVCAASGGLDEKPDGGRYHQGHGRPAKAPIRRRETQQGQTRRTWGDLLLVERRVSVLAFHLVRQGRNGGPDAATTQGAQDDDQDGGGSKEECMTT